MSAGGCEWSGGACGQAESGTSDGEEFNVQVGKCADLYSMCRTNYDPASAFSQEDIDNPESRSFTFEIA